MGTEFEKRVIEKLSEISNATKEIGEIKELVKGLDTLNRNIEEQNKNIEKLIKILVERESKKD